jgi:hypothetical protein
MKLKNMGMTFGNDVLDKMNVIELRDYEKNLWIMEKITHGILKNEKVDEMNDHSKFLIMWIIAAEVSQMNLKNEDDACFTKKFKAFFRLN